MDTTTTVVVGPTVPVSTFGCVFSYQHTNDQEKEYNFGVHLLYRNEKSYVTRHLINNFLSKLMVYLDSIGVCCFENFKSFLAL